MVLKGFEKTRETNKGIKTADKDLTGGKKADQVKTKVQGGGWYTWLIDLLQPYIHLPHPILPPASNLFIHPSPLFSPEGKTKWRFHCGCSKYGITMLCFLGKILSCCFNTTAKKTNLTFLGLSKKRKKRNWLTFFFFLKLTFTPSTETTMLTFFFLMFFTLNSYCGDKTRGFIVNRRSMWRSDCICINRQLINTKNKC